MSRNEKPAVPLPGFDEYRSRQGLPPGHSSYTEVLHEHKKERIAAEVAEYEKAKARQPSLKRSVDSYPSRKIMIFS